MVKHYRSLREHIEALRALGELREVDQEVDWNLEIGAITRRICETGGPAVLDRADRADACQLRRRLSGRSAGPHPARLEVGLRIALIRSPAAASDARLKPGS